jgi:hypothetical protein
MSLAHSRAEHRSVPAVDATAPHRAGSKGFCYLECPIPAGLAFGRPRRPRLQSHRRRSPMPCWPEAPKREAPSANRISRAASDPRSRLVRHAEATAPSLTATFFPGPWQRNQGSPQPGRLLFRCSRLRWRQPDRRLRPALAGDWSRPRRPSAVASASTLRRGEVHDDSRFGKLMCATTAIPTALEARPTAARE